MIKKLLVAVLLLIVLAVGAVFYYLDSLVENGIEVVGTRVLGTQVAVDSVGLSPLSGSGSIAGLSIANPEGFSSEYAFELGQIDMQLNVGSLSTDTIEIDSIIIDSPRITYDTNLRDDNIRALLRNIGGGGDSGASTEDGAPGKDLLIRDFQMRNPQLNLVTAVASAPVSLPDIQITDIGTGSNGASAREVIRLILGRVNQAIIEGNIPGVENLRNRARETLQDAENQARDSVDNAVEDLGNRLRDILN